MPCAELFFFENRFRPITGDVGFIGRQTTYLTERSLSFLAMRYQVAAAPGFVVEMDKETTAAAIDSPAGSLISDRSLIKFFGGRYRGIDVSDYEGADIVVDLSYPVPKKFHDKYDFIYDGSCLDNIFNPAEALMNMSKMLRPGGRMIILNHATHFNGPYTCFSPGWFFDFFVANKYEDCKVYLLLFENEQQLKYGPMRSFVYNWTRHHVGMMPPLPGAAHAMLVVVAEKGASSTSKVQPVQAHYRDRAYAETTFKENVEIVLASERPFFGHPDVKGVYASPQVYVEGQPLGVGIPL